MPSGDGVTVAGRSGGLLPRAAYLQASILAVLALALVILIPPFQNADETAHFLRAAHLAAGHVIGEKFAGTSGGPVDTGVSDAITAVAALPFHPEEKLTADRLDALLAAEWTGQPALQPFQNTAIYPPFLYLPSIVAVWAGQASGLGVAATLWLARCLTLLVSLALMLAAVRREPSRWTGYGALFLLPMTAALAGAVSQDGPMLGLAALFGARVAAGVRSGGCGRGEIAVSAVIIGLCALGRPPYLFLAFLLPLAAAGRRAGWIAALAVTAATLGWSVWAGAEAMAPPVFPWGTPEPKAQAAFMLANPFATLWTFGATLAHLGWSWIRQFVGILGWLDTKLPAAAYILAPLTLIALLPLRAAPATGATLPRRTVWIAAVLASLVFVSILASLYLTWSPVGAPRISGVQGRYFLPLAVALLPFLPTWPVPSHPLAAAGLRWGLRLWPVVVAGMTIWAVLKRYHIPL